MTSVCCEDKDLISSSVTEITSKITVYVELHIYEVFIHPYALELFITPLLWQGTSSSLFYFNLKKIITHTHPAILQVGGDDTPLTPQKNHPNQTQVTYVQPWLIHVIAVLLKKHFHSGRSGNNSLTLKAFNQNAWYHLF